MGAAVTFLTALFQAVPIAERAVQWLMLTYLQWKYRGMKQEDVEAFHKLMISGDQRDFEKLLGYSRAGLPSGVPGAVVVPGLPGLPVDNAQGSGSGGVEPEPPPAA